MATKRICDRCGAEINPAHSVTYAGTCQYRYDYKMSHELCSSCAYLLDRWLAGKEQMVGERRDNE